MRSRLKVTVAGDPRRTGHGWLDSPLQKDTRPMVASAPLPPCFSSDGRAVTDDWRHPGWLPPTPGGTLSIGVVEQGTQAGEATTLTRRGVPARKRRTRQHI